MPERMYLPGPHECSVLPGNAGLRLLTGGSPWQRSSLQEGACENPGLAPTPQSALQSSCRAPNDTSEATSKHMGEARSPGLAKLHQRRIRRLPFLVMTCITTLIRRRSKEKASGSY